MKKTPLKIIFAVILFFLCAGCGITAGSLSREPGYAPLHFPAFWQADEEVSISLGPAIMSLARMFIDEEDEVSQLIKNIKGLHLRVYTVADNLEVLNRHVDESAVALNQRGWEQLVSVREDGEYAVVLVKMEEEEIQGLVVLTTDDREAVFINVIGNIEPASLRPLIAEVYEDIPAVTTRL